MRSRQMMGADARYVPGWDCHGLPIEWKIEEQYRERGRDKDQVPVVEFRRECREFAAAWVDVQREEFRRLGVTGNWADPYLTMDFHAERVIAESFQKFLMSGVLYQGSKPVMWSPVERTALAEAEVEYRERQTDAVWVAVSRNMSDISQYHSGYTPPFVSGNHPGTTTSNRAMYRRTRRLHLLSFGQRPHGRSRQTGRLLQPGSQLRRIRGDRPPEGSWLRSGDR